MKIDTTSIKGFAEMSDADKVAALLNLDLQPNFNPSDYVEKKVFDAKATEAANYAKQLKERMSESEIADKEKNEAHQKLQEQYNELLKKSTIAEHTSNYLALGYDKDLAKSTAEALFDGDMDKVFENQKKFNEEREKQLRADMVRKDPRPDGAGGGDDQKDSNVEYARNLGKQRAASMASSVSALEKYKVGK